MEEEMEKTGEAETVAEAAKEAVETLKEKSLEELAEDINGFRRRMRG